MFRTWSARIPALAVTSLLLAGGCRDSSRPATASRGVHLAIAMALPPSTRGSTSADLGLPAIVQSISSERLVRVRPDGRFESALAERWERSADGLIWRFSLRSNLRFHDGSTLDARRVAASLSSDLAKGRLSGAGFQGLAEVTPADGNVLTFRLRQPSSLFLQALGGLPIRAGKIESGPFEVVSRQPDEAQLKAFDSYFRGRPAIDTISIKIYPSPRSAWSAMMRGEVDFLLDVSPEAIDFVEQSSRASVKNYMRPYTYMVGLNVRQPALKVREVRVALNQAINRTKLIDAVFRGRAFPASNHVWPRHWAYDHMIPHFRFVPDKASRQLEEAGFPLKATTPGRPKSRFSFVCLIPDIDMRYERIGLMLQQQLQDIGVDMQLQVMPILDLIKRLGKGDYDAALMDLNSPFGLGSLYDFWHSPGTNPVFLFDSGYTGADEALDDLQRADTDDEVRRALHNVQRVMYDDPPAIFLCWGERSRVVSTRFLPAMVPNRDVLTTLPEWRLAPAASSP